MSAIPVSHSQQLLRSKAVKSEAALSGLSVLHNPADHPSLRSLPFVCIAQDLTVVSGDTRFCVSGIFLSPGGDVSIILESLPSASDISRIVERVRSWEYDDLESMASDYTYLNYGQAFRIIDMMAKRGHLKFSDAADLAGSVSRNLEYGNFYLLCADSPF